MSASGGDRLGVALAALGARTLYTLCGGHIAPILVGAKRAGIRVVDVRDEASAVFAADATARLGGGLGVAAVTAGPGVTNAVTAVTNAAEAQSPLLLVGGAAPTVLRGRGALQDIEQVPMLRPHVKWTAAARRVRELVPLLQRAAHEATRGVPGPAYLEIPVDLLYDEHIVRDWYAAGTGSTPTLAARAQRWYLRRHLRAMFAGADRPDPAAPAPAVTPDPDPGPVGRTAGLLARAVRPVLVIGSQAMLAPGRVAHLAAAVGRLGIPTYLSGMARGLLGREHPLALRHGRRAALREADLVILAGVPCDFRLDYGRHIGRGATLIAVNRSRREARRNRRPTLTAVGDAGRFLELLGAAVVGGRWTAWCATLAARDAARSAEIAAMAEERGAHVNPLALCRTIEDLAPDDSVFVLDGGDFAATASYVVAPRGPLRHLDPGVFGTLGVGAGFALAAKLHRPAAEVWLLYGDGAAGYSLAEFDTMVRHGLPVIAVVGNDAAWTQIAREQIPILGDDVGTALRRTDYHTVAEGYGGVGLLVRTADEVRPALARAQAEARAGRPVLVNAWLDPTEFRKGSISM